MAGLEELKKKLEPLFDAEKGLSIGMSLDPGDSYMVSDSGTVNLLSRSCGVYNINELGLQKRSAGITEVTDTDEKTYRCASHEMHVFGAIGCGASSVVQRAISLPVHRVLALKRINVYEKEKRQQILNEIRTLCEAACYSGLVEFHGAFYAPDSGHISIALEYMDGGSLADVLRVKKFIPEPTLSFLVKRLLEGINYLHTVRHLVHRDIKPANLLLNLKGEPKITDFGVSAGLENSIAMCATFVGTVTYMSPERIRNEAYFYPADIWSLGLAIFECGTGEFPYKANEGPANLMLQILYDPSPTPPRDFSSEFCSFIDACLQKDPDARPTAEQLLSHPFIKKYENSDVDLSAYVKSVVDPTQRLKDIADMLAVHYYLLFDGSDGLWHHMRTFYTEHSTFSFSGKSYTGDNDIFSILSDVRRKLAGNHPCEKLIHVVEKLHCRAHGQDGIMIRASGSFILGSHFLICGDGVQAEGMPNMQDIPFDIASRRVGTFHEQFCIVPGTTIGCYVIDKQELYIQQA
ncbi:mitogen-activated protein kinase kinase 3 [Ananas comosus]|uniref:mitogen-activated protein kinase kinase n=1 Tax=Ananas comosus TaxID=4615 RepID=A0A6P5F0E6_ANACO|nr:mitogen-activated protein kinase kinase 3 [Ananas comosus]XP_020089614.1 mitogen-activated protein kinase kinase 3 [Ananas comosus]XP_020089615.1 mitogen-activated protein kinase kinase 3 [Ananas comosus]XP_020089616.1 mitogen-activated protein kinase kinase 3 [Ananas comosus]XP_020089617.1 mitogen-activated protein kinase kinase 3 [Ananas comosus]XP_020089618.1 mitogen-activated protein kinase kinase 3 [Ananas comosus]XP_020089619.1 mitogen-activated protein kinase kinase 3 [Ananas comosu